MKLSLKLQADYFFNVWVFVAVILTFVNDRILKSFFNSYDANEGLVGVHYFMSVLTGKLSDFAGLFFFPVFLVYVVHRLCGQKFSHHLIICSCLVTAVQFVLFKFVDFFKNELIEFFNRMLFPIQIVSDPTDVFALSSIVIAYLFLKKYIPTAP